MPNKNGFPSEEDEQIEIFRWAAAFVSKYPDLKFMYHTPNGGKRDSGTAVKFKRQGVKAGVPDICLALPKGKYHGLYIELKAVGGTLSDAQCEYLCWLKKNGYCATVCIGAQRAIAVIEEYLNL